MPQWPKAGHDTLLLASDTNAVVARSRSPIFALCDQHSPNSPAHRTSLQRIFFAQAYMAFTMAPQCTGSLARSPMPSPKSVVRPTLKQSLHKRRSQQKDEGGQQIVTQDREVRQARTLITIGKHLGFA